MKILAADDDRIALRLLVSTLERWEYTVVSASNGTDAWEALQQEDAPKLAILDWMMPGMDGIEICRRLRGLPDAQYVYVLLLTSRGEKEDIVEGLESGADDFVIKPYHLMELRARLLAGQRILRLEAELRDIQDRLRFQASHDGLTGLFNRTMIVNSLRRELERAARENADVSVIMVDVDHFKRVNDTYGHLAGDAVLREVATRMQASLRVYDGLGRYGGEEFLAVLWRCGRNEASVVAERLRMALAQAPIVAEGASILVTISLGVAVAHYGQPRDPTALLRLADAALYHAKRTGRNRVEMAASPEEVGRGHSDDTPVSVEPQP